METSPKTLDAGNGHSISKGGVQKRKSLRNREVEDIPEGALVPGKKVVRIQLEPIAVKEMTLTIRGTSPLIVHGWGQKTIRQMLDQQTMSKEEKKKAKENRKAKKPEDDFEEAKYKVDGKDCFPVCGIKKALVEAGYAVGIPKTQIRQALFIVGTVGGSFAEIKYKKCVMREDTVRVGPWSNRVADLRYRPQYDDWSIKLTVRYRTDMLDEKQVAILFQNAGVSIGIGEWRVQRDGLFGSFEVA